MSKDLIQQNRDDAQWVLSTEQGRRFMWRLLSYCGVYQDVGGPQEEVYKQLGKRNVGLHLLGIISDASEDQLFEMMKEAKNRTLEEKIEHERTTRSETSRTINTALDQLIDGSELGPGYSSEPGPVF